MANLKVNMSMTKNEMPEQDPIVRAGNFDEVALGYDAETAMKEAARCLDCKNSPCRSGCPVSVKIPRFLEKVREGDFDAAYDIITSTNSLPAVCGRVCPQEKQCESKCVRGIKGEAVGIGRLERFVADYHMSKADKPEPKAPASNGHRIAVIGSGPAGLTCAGDLCKMGYDVTIFEAFHKSGGVLVYGIPQFRLPKEIVAAEIENLTKMGVKIVNNAIIGRSITVDELFEETGKKIVRTENEIRFSQIGETLVPYQLSSGEKQMLAILLTVLVEDQQPYVLFMDEPEVSLHIEWQKRLIDLIVELNPNVQIILTTHSPAVIMNGWMDKVTEVSDITL